MICAAISTTLRTQPDVMEDLLD